MRKKQKTFWTVSIAIALLFIIGLALLLLKPNNLSDRAKVDTDSVDALGVVRFDKKIMAPSFALKDLNGSEVRLDDLRGKIVFLNFWATWCPPCREEMPSMEKLYGEFKNRDFTMLAIDLREDVLKVKTYKEESGLTFPILLDSDGSVGLEYGVISIPTTYVVDREGYLIGGALGARDWSSPEAFELINQLLGTPPTS